MSRQMRRMRQNVVILVIQSQNSIHIKELLVSLNWGIDSACRRGETGKDMDEGSEHPTGLEKLQNGERIGKPCLQAYLFRNNHEASVWKIILPDCLAGICHYTRCDWLRYLSGPNRSSNLAR